MPSDGVAKFWMAASSSWLRPVMSSGGNCPRREAEANAEARLACWTIACMKATVPPAGTVTLLQP